MKYFRCLPYIMEAEEDGVWLIKDREYRVIGKVKLSNVLIARFESCVSIIKDSTGEPYQICLYKDKTYPIEKHVYWQKYTECLRILADAEMV